MNIMKLLSLFLILSGLLTPTPSLAQSDVHFGTIFIENINYENADDSQKVNALTDSSFKQQQLETLYKNEIGIPNQKIKKINTESRAPASVKKEVEDDLTQKVGVLKNNELPRKIIYFLELRSFIGNSSKPIVLRDGPNNQEILSMQPGELIKVTDTPPQYVHKMRMDRDNQGLWKSVSTREQDVKNPQIYYDWRNFETITSHDIPVELDVLVPYGKNSVPVFNSPGAWTWKDCGLSEQICISNIDLHTKAYLFDATIVDVRLSEKSASDYRLFYKIGYQQKDKNGRVQHLVGWIPATHAKRKISQLPKSLLATRAPNSFGAYESDEERTTRLKKYYVFDSNLESSARSINRWISSTPGQSTEIFANKFAIDGIASFNTFHLEQSFLQREYDQTGVAAGFGMFAPIYLDLELQGTFIATVPLTSNADDDPIFEDTTLFRAEQWLLYTTPINISGVPLKFGFGGYYQTMFSGSDQFGFNSLVGFQAKGLFEGSSFWTGFRYGPTGNDFSFSFENREIGLELGYRFNPEKKYKSWSIFGDYSDTAYTSSPTSSTKFQTVNIGVRKQF